MKENIMPSEPVNDLVELIRKYGGSITLTKMRNHRRRWRDSEQAELALRGLVRHGYGTLDMRPASPRGGRPSQVFTLFEPLQSVKSPENAGVPEVVSMTA